MGAGKDSTIYAGLYEFHRVLHIRIAFPTLALSKSGLRVKAYSLLSAGFAPAPHLRFSLYSERLKIAIFKNVQKITARSFLPVR